MQFVQNVSISGKPDVGFRSKLEAEIDKACTGLYIAHSYYSCIALAIHEVCSIDFLRELFSVEATELSFNARSKNNRLVFSVCIRSCIDDTLPASNQVLTSFEGLELIKSICDSVYIDDKNRCISLYFDILSFTNSNSIMRAKSLRKYFELGKIEEELIK